MNYGFIPIRNIEDGMKAILDGNYKKDYPRSEEIIEYGYYYKYLRKYQKYFDSASIRILLNEDIKSNPLGAVGETFRFLGVNDCFVPKVLYSRPMLGSYNITRLRFLTIRNKLLFNYSNDRMRLFEKEWNITGKLAAGIIKMIDRLCLSPLLVNKRPAISSELHKRLLDLYVDDLKQLQKLLNRKMDKWIQVDS